MQLAQVAGKVYLMQLSNFLFVLFGVLVILCPCDARSTIDRSSKLVDNGETLVSTGKKFEMGFFSDDGDHLNRYVGIWYYKLSPRTVVWVANGSNPIRGSKIKNEDISVVVAEDGNLRVWNSNSNYTYFSSGLESVENPNRTVELLDSGNLVLVEESGVKRWESFLNPTDTFLPGMTMNEKLNLTDSKSGNYTFQLDQNSNKKYVIFDQMQRKIHWKGSVPLDNSVKGNSVPFRFSEMPAYVAYLLNFTESDILNKTATSFNRKYTPIDFKTYANHSINNSIFEGTRLVMNSSGEIQFYSWDKEIWSAPKDKCDVYRTCGKFEICNNVNHGGSVCRCLHGFNHDPPENYEEGEEEFSGGCSRTSVGSCERDTFVDLTSMKFGEPDGSRESNTSEDCRRLCLGNCTCQAYTYSNNSGCWIWWSNLKNLQENYAGGFNLSIRVSHIEVAVQGPLSTNTAPSRYQRALVIPITLILGVIILCGTCYIIYLNRRAARSKEAQDIVLGKPMEYLRHRDSSDEDLITEDDKKRIDVPFFSLNSILVATENFSNATKLGRGGFGPVYEGKFLGGTYMAVKRLSSQSGQGVEEFKTEVMLIAKLQHRNLVRLLGYCVEAKEKILLYEYMPNKSLDTFLFDHASCQLLDWRIRFEIILGVARGLLYLHQDSRLRIIHRDLKTSNILLDEEMNAKISDFGLARIVEGKNTEANTNKVVGTYGYMSPEYALEGLFSIKSDVFAFGVVLLEIISGKRNMECFEDVNLTGYIWRLWMKDRALDVMDQTIAESCDEKEVIKCMNVALLCVQEDPAERPTMSNVVFMLGGESMTLPRPNQPAFIARRNSAGASTSSSSSKLYSSSNNGLTITQQEGRSDLFLYLLLCILSTYFVLTPFSGGCVSCPQVQTHSLVIHLFRTPFLLFGVLLSFRSLYFWNTINGSSKLVDNGETLVSTGEKFEMGFFSYDGDQSNKYVGIWYYNVSPRTVVWVANWKNPIQASRIKNEDISIVVEDGDFKVWNSNSKDTYFSTQIGSADNGTVELLDTGNLVLVGESGVKRWESFLYPTDTFLPGMKMDERLKLTDSRSGNYTFQFDQSSKKKYVILQTQGGIHWKGSAELATSGHFSFGQMPGYVAYMLSNFTKNDTVNNSVEATPGTFKYYRLLMNSSGEIQFYGLDKQVSGWSLMWSAPKDTCDVYKKCGKFSICNSNHEPVCKCLPGFEPDSAENLRAGEFSGGCSRMSVNSCKDNVEALDTFLDLKSMKFGSSDRSYKKINTNEDCRKFCLGNCTCEAYTFDNSGCSIWFSSLKNLQENYNGGFNLSVRVSISEIEATRRNCKPCGRNVIPYPLSSGPYCGDPLYYSFSCDDLAGQVSFQTSKGNYTVINFDRGKNTFVIEAADKESAGNCDDKGLVTGISWFNQSSSFKVIDWCFNPKKNLTSAALSRRNDLILISWNPPLEPICTTSENCTDWPNSTCNVTEQGDRRCICKSDYKWDGLILNCSLSSDHGTQGPSIAKRPPSRNQRALLISISLILGIIILCCTSYIIYLNNRVARTKESRKIVLGNPMVHLPRREIINEDLITADEKKQIDVPFFSLNSILVATDYFSNATKLGQGGFGPVYKGKFPEGADLAVKRLSSHSGQGVEEFKTEVMLIAKLQHRNLVRLLGYCVEANEKILLYEYMSNKSLDTFIFDHRLCRLLDWRTRFDIVLGIARGLLYLHQDSRLRIIHRDLKTSNILLDEEMNAKISDFGLARIVEGKSTEANTNRVVGTYGYMSPEYALEGLFSIKSDVFAFGVVVLEIISGMRNMNFFEDVNLTGYVWRLWMKDKALDMMDQTIVDSCEDKEVIKCINVALLCLQEDPGDRPTMSNVVLMLGGESMTLPRPNQPHFITRRNASSTSSSSSKHYCTSNKQLTITHEEEGR
ncbi:uncharacterized protein LOC132619497 [Lycium barbarum]|uniref:uncharacterized protein LOC132619497 n=1 Tax=Lycium barbarum TaxID=112863 RepID=UPI00293EDBDB|nr:uncharacterized protein LOC132619497 [Lycium barbarum]